ncbi:hypothetical protein MTO96_032949 [Rhipicephalus appendiculatus]
MVAWCLQVHLQGFNRHLFSPVVFVYYLTLVFGMKSFFITMIVTIGRNTLKISVVSITTLPKPLLWDSCKGQSEEGKRKVRVYCTRANVTSELAEAGTGLEERAIHFASRSDEPDVESEDDDDDETPSEKKQGLGLKRRRPKNAIKCGGRKPPCPDGCSCQRRRGKQYCMLKN